MSHLGSTMQRNRQILRHSLSRCHEMFGQCLILRGDVTKNKVVVVENLYLSQNEMELRRNFSILPRSRRTWDGVGGFCDIVFSGRRAGDCATFALEALSRNGWKLRQNSSRQRRWGRLCRSFGRVGTAGEEAGRARSILLQKDWPSSRSGLGCTTSKKCQRPRFTLCRQRFACDRMVLPDPGKPSSWLRR
jgi:hypothetical protein